MRNTKSYDLDPQSRSQIAAALAAPVADRPALDWTPLSISDADLAMKWELKPVATVSKAHREAIERQSVYEAKQAARDESSG